MADKTRLFEPALGFSRLIQKSRLRQPVFSSPKSRARLLSCLFLLIAATAVSGQTPLAPTPAPLPEAPSALLLSACASDSGTEAAVSSSNPAEISSAGFSLDASGLGAQTAAAQKPTAPVRSGDVDVNGNPIPLNRQQPKRILGFMPNFRSVSGGAVVHPPGWKYNFKVAARQSFDYSSFVFLGLTSLTSEATDEHPALGKGVDGYWAYTWRGFLDKTDNTFETAWLWPSALHEDTRFYALGHGNVVKRALYVLSREVVARNYSGNQTPNIANIGGKVLTQYISTFYYPATSENFSVLATKFSYSLMRDVGFNSIREFYPDIAAYYARKHQQRLLKQQNP